MKNFKKIDKTTIVINILCSYLGEDSKEFQNIIKNKHNRYLILLLLKNYKCLNKERIKLLFNLSSDKSINYSIKKAEEKLLINKEFRESYLSLEKFLEDVI